MSDRNQFEAAANQRRSSLAGEFWHFLMTNKKWWLLPILIVMGLFGMLAVLGSGALAPYIYTLW
jgi:hypothetical protein